MDQGLLKRRVWRAACFLTLGVGLAACASAPQGTGTETGSDAYKIADLKRYEGQITEALDQAGPSITDARDLPTSGQADYSGIMTMSVPALDDTLSTLIYGRAEASVDFAGADTRFEGSATEFRDLADDSYEGALTFSGAVTPSATNALTLSGGGVLTGDLDGTLTGPNSEEIVVDAAIYTSAFEGAEALSGTIFGSGTVSAPDGQGGTSGTIFGSLLLADESLLTP